jgi:2,5-diketo-D-gluconate reductase A
MFLASQGAAAVETLVKLRNGVLMPAVAVSLGAANETSENIEIAWKSGVTHFVTASNYGNQAQVGVGLKELKVARDSFFLTTMTSPCICNQPSPRCERQVSDPEECYALTKQDFQQSLEELDFEFVDLLLLHGPNGPYENPGKCEAQYCAANRAQWRAYGELLAAGKARAIGVSNFCPSCLDCILAQPGVEAPVVNEVQYHIGMGPDPSGLLTYHQAHGIVLQSYYPLGHGAVLKDQRLESISAAHNKSTAQVAMRWILQNAKQSGGAIFTSSINPSHLRQDLDLFDWELTAGEMASLDAITCEAHPEYCSYMDGRLGWGCGY